VCDGSLVVFARGDEGVNRLGEGLKDLPQDFISTTYFASTDGNDFVPIRARSDPETTSKKPTTWAGMVDPLRADVGAALLDMATRWVPFA
jgi:hypothetical protein